MGFIDDEQEDGVLIDDGARYEASLRILVPENQIVWVADDTTNGVILSADKGEILLEYIENFVHLMILCAKVGIKKQKREKNLIYIDKSNRLHRFLC